MICGHNSPAVLYRFRVSLRGISSGGQIVAMMQTAQPWRRYNRSSSARLVCLFPTGRRSFRQGKMGSVVVVIADVIIHQTFQVLLIQDDYMVEQISAAVADPAFCNSVLPRTSETGPFGLDSEALYGIDHLRVELCTAIKDQVAGRRVVKECLAQLLNHPRAG